ncbi:ROK family transcriptional regulator [Ostreiculturibacter nitratireducens]|uniref:ROK family transcriptional regulator n=1 Tax=Ostreiculturibacter nitratireducens TaxID=3075226 RepID=UPI0031B5B6E1
MPDPTLDIPGSEGLATRGSNQAGMRAHNERLVLSLVRQGGELSKTDIAQMTGLSAQTVSVIMRGLEAEGLLVKGEPIRGRIGQPSVPMSLNGDGAFFFGLKIGRRSVDLALVDFLGNIRGFRRQVWSYPTPDAVLDFVEKALPILKGELPKKLQSRIVGLGVAMPFQLWSWIEHVGAPQHEMDAWRVRDIQSELAALTGIGVHVQNDATAACGAELVFGTGERPKDFLYFYLAYFIGGGLVLNGRLYTGRSGNAAGMGPMPVPTNSGEPRRLIEVASMSVLARDLEKAGEDARQLWETPDWTVKNSEVLDRWLTEAANGLAHASLSATTLLELHSILIDGWVPSEVRAEITRRTHDAFHKLDLSGIEPPVIREGTVGPQARVLGAAAIPLAMRYLTETGVS